MEYLDLFIKIGAGLTALGVIISLIVKVFKVITETQKAIGGFREDLEDLKEHSHENYMGILRLTIMSNEMPIGERIVAGDKYLKNNGNGDVKIFLQENFNITDSIDHATHYKKG